MKFQSTFWYAVLILALAFPTLCVAQEDLFLRNFVRDEATYQGQKIQMPRSSLKKPLTLRMQLERIGMMQKFTRGVVVYSYTRGMESYVYKDVNELLDMDPIHLTFNIKGGKLHRKQFEMNVSIHLNYVDRNGKESCLVVHNRSRGLMDTAIYTRTSIMMPSEETTDDLRSFRSKASPLSISYLTVFDAKKLSKEMKAFDEIKKNAIAKYNANEQLSKIEEECIIGLREMDMLYNQLGYGDWLYSDQRYYDALVEYTAVFENLKHGISPNNNEFNELFYGLAHKMGICNLKLGNHEAADYYLELAAFGDEKYKETRLDFFNNDKLTTFNPIGPNNPMKVTVGDVLSILLDAREENIREGIINVSGNTTKLATRKEVYDYDLNNLCSPTAPSLTIAYSRSGFDCDNPNREDKSKTYFENNIIITSVKADSDKWRINVLVPHFKSNDYRKPNSEYNYPYTASFILGTKPIKGYNLALTDSIDSIIERFTIAYDLHNEARVLEAYKLFKDIELQILKSATTLDKKSLSLYSAILYKIGCIYQDLDLTTKAISTLRRSLLVETHLESKMEYIIALSNYTDPRAIGIIKNELDASPEDQGYLNVLYRRYAYLLIEYYMLDEAEAFLTKLLNQPGCENFARSELDYIKSIRQ